MKIDKDEILRFLNKGAKQFGYTIVPSELWEKLKNEVASLNDAINVYENKEVDDAERR